MPGRSRILRLLLACLLLVSQQTALLHAAWHAARAPATEQGQSRPVKQGSKHDGGQGGLCVFDAVLGHLLGGACGGPAVALPAACGAQPVATVPEFRCSEPYLPYLSRGPPALL